MGKEIAVTFGLGLRTSPFIRIEEPTPKTRTQAWELFSRHRDEACDLIDCTSFALMDAFGIREVFGFDRHLPQYGFRLLPA